MFAVEIDIFIIFCCNLKNSYESKLEKKEKKLVNKHYLKK